MASGPKQPSRRNRPPAPRPATARDRPLPGGPSPREPRRESRHGDDLVEAAERDDRGNGRRKPAHPHCLSASAESLGQHQQDAQTGAAHVGQVVQVQEEGLLVRRHLRHQGFPECRAVHAVDTTHGGGDQDAIHPFPTDLQVHGSTRALAWLSGYSAHSDRIPMPQAAGFATPCQQDSASLPEDPPRRGKPRRNELNRPWNGDTIPAPYDSGTNLTMQSART